MNNAQKVAVAKAVSAANVKKAKSALKPGTHRVDMTIRVQGVVTKGEDYEKFPTTSTPWLKVVGLLVHRSGAHRDHTLQLLQNALKDVNDMSKEEAAEVMEKSGVNACILKFKAEALAGVEMQHADGPCTSKLTFKVVEPDANKAATK
jgi:hypothetical protein